MTAIAKIRGYCTPPSVSVKTCMANDSVKFCFERRISVGHTYSFQALMKKMMPVAVTVGRHTGSTTSRMMRNSPTPSRCEISMSDLGIARMAWRTRKMPDASASCGRMTPTTVSSSPSLEMVR